MERKAYQRSQAWEKFEILETVASCPLSVRKACEELGIPRSTYQRWRRAYREKRLEGLNDIPPIPHHRPHRKTEEERQKVLKCASIHTHLGPRSLAPYLWDEYRIPISPKTIYNILKAEGWVRQRKKRIKAPEPLPVYPEPESPNEVWQADFMYVYVDGYGFYQLFTFLDAFSRLPIHHELLGQATSEVAAAALKKAVERNGRTPPQVIVTDNGSAFVNLKGKKPTAFQQACSELGITHRRIPFGHPQSIGRIERFHRTMREEEISLHRYSNPEEARECIRAAIERYSTQRYHQGIGNIKPIDRHEGREQEIRARREELFSSIKRNGRKSKVLTLA
jgi:transposase InsO family protein